MSRERRRELTAAYKEVKARPGLFVIRCQASGEAWVFSARNLGNRQNGIWFTLRMGGHTHRQMQAAWKAHGEDSFSYAELESINAVDLAAWQVAERLKEREAHWREALAPAIPGA